MSQTTYAHAMTYDATIIRVSLQVKYYFLQGTDKSTSVRNDTSKQVPLSVGCWSHSVRCSHWAPFYFLPHQQCHASVARASDSEL
jgi:hypothetical protein